MSLSNLLINWRVVENSFEELVQMQPCSPGDRFWSLNYALLAHITTQPITSATDNAREYAYLVWAQGQLSPTPQSELTTMSHSL